MKKKPKFGLISLYYAFKKNLENISECDSCKDYLKI